MKKIRKLTSLLLVLVMSLALAVPCFAAETGPEEYGEIVDEWDDGEFHVQIIELDEDANLPKPRAVIQSARTFYSDSGEQPINWACSVYTALYVDLDCRNSRCDVNFTLKLDRQDGSMSSRSNVFAAGGRYSVHVERNPEFQSLVSCHGTYEVWPAGGSGMECAVSVNQYMSVR